MGRVFKPGPCSACGEQLVKGRCNRGMCERCASRIYLAEHPRSKLCDKCGKEHDRRLRCEPTAEIACSECGDIGLPFAKGICQPCYNRRYHAANRDALNAKNSAAQARNPEAARLRSLQFHVKHPGYSAERGRANYPRYAATPEGRERLRNNVLRRRAKKRGLLATFTTTDWRDVLTDFNHRCAYCGKAVPLEREHFIPVELDGPFTRWNILPACLPCNRSKGAKHPITFCPLLYDHLARYLSKFLYGLS